jgi:amino acid transporter
LLFALVRDMSPGHTVGSAGRNGTPAAAAVVITSLIALIALVCATAFSAKPFDTFLWSGTIGTLILLVAYLLATVGCIKLIWIDKKMSVPTWEIVIPLLALVMLGYTLYRNVFPYPTEGPARWFPVVAFGWLLVVTVAMLAAPGVARRLAAGMADLDDSAKETV